MPVIVLVLGLMLVLGLVLVLVLGPCGRESILWSPRRYYLPAIRTAPPSNIRDKTWAIKPFKTTACPSRVSRYRRRAATGQHHVEQCLSGSSISISPKYGYCLLTCINLVTAGNTPAQCRGPPWPCGGPRKPSSHSNLVHLVVGSLVSVTVFCSVRIFRTAEQNRGGGLSSQKPLKAAIHSDAPKGLYHSSDA
ncbi:hypothetical protein LY78DRAFT_654861 [Colletotrichum sublineola]|nr:hypothetical protein LY78DRAFT_654861 [Colletotrichum sublineola]